MKWKATAVGAVALVLVAGAFVFALATRGGADTPTAVTTVSSPTPLGTGKPLAKNRARSVSKPSCQSDTTDPTGSDSPSCGSGDNQAGDRSRDSSGDNQAGDRNSGDSSGDDQAGDRNSGDSSGDNQAGDGKAGGP